MSARQLEPQIAVKPARETSGLFGHREAEAALLNAYRSGRIAHAWLIGGARGIGKATLAYRMARFVLAHRNPLGAGVQRAETLAVDPSDPLARGSPPARTADCWCWNARSTIRACCGP